MKSKYFMALAIVLFVAACSNNDMTVKVKHLMSMPITLPKDLSDSTSMIKIVRYVKPKSCTSCQLELGLWRVYKKYIQKKFGDKVGIKFVIDSKNVKEVERLISVYNFRNISSIDSVEFFAKNNQSVIDIGTDVVMVLDKLNNVILIGNPCKNNKIQSLTDSIIMQRIGKSIEKAN